MSRQLPRTLKNMNVFVDGSSFAGVAKTVTLPKITKKTEDYRGAGMIGDVALDLGYEKMECEVTYAGFDPRQYQQLSRCGVSDLPIRFVQIHERQDTCAIQNAEYYMRGQAIEVDPGDSTLGEMSEYKSMYNVTYMRLEVDGRLIFELDFVNGIETFGETSLIDEIMRLLGL